MDPRLTARMLGTWSRPWCPHCRAPAGPDCPDASVPRKTRRAREKAAWKREAGRWGWKGWNES